MEKCHLNLRSTLCSSRGHLESTRNVRISAHVVVTELEICSISLYAIHCRQREFRMGWMGWIMRESFWGKHGMRRSVGSEGPRCSRRHESATSVKRLPMPLSSLERLHPDLHRAMKPIAVNIASRALSFAYFDRCTMFRSHAALLVASDVVCLTSGFGFQNWRHWEK